MKKTLIYDLPTRLFHWVFAALFIGAYGIANTTDDESVIFSFHMLLGIVMFSAFVLRIVWGFTGSRYAKFSSFELAPEKLIQYVKDVINNKGKLFAGHNPASSWVAVIMFLLTAGLMLSGFMMAIGVKGVKEPHEVMAHLFLAIAVVHVLGVIIHTIRHRDPIALSMIGGYKNLEQGEEITASHPLVALIFIAIIGYLSTHLFTQFNPGTRTLNLFGQTLQLGENEDHEHGKPGEGREHDEDGHGGDDD